MLEFVYTGAGNKVREQVEPSLSLGGFISTSLVPNDFEGSMFSGIGRETKQNDIIVLGVSSNIPIVDLQITILDLYNSSIGYKGGGANFVLDACGIFKTEVLPNRFSKPRGIPLGNIRSTNAFLTLTFDNAIVAGETLSVDEDSVELFSFTTTSNTPTDLVDYLNTLDGHYAVKKFNYELNAYQVFLFREDFINFGVITDHTFTEVTETNCVENYLEVGDMDDNVLALYLQRILPSQNENKVNCERLFADYTEGVQGLDPYTFKIWAQYTAD